MSILVNTKYDNYDLNQSMNSTKIVITKFHEKLRKSSFLLPSEIKIIKDVCKKPRNRPILKYSDNFIKNFKSRQPESLYFQSLFGKINFKMNQLYESFHTFKSD